MELVNIGFINWLLYNCTTKVVIKGQVNYYWTLNVDYENSWDGGDVKLYNTEQIFEYYQNKK